MQPRATSTLRRNIEALLRARGQTQHDLAMWCRRTDSWLSKILDDQGNRGLPLKYLDRIADFFGIATYQLFQPGISPLLERRKGDRRRGLDRRVADPTAIMRSPADNARELVRMVLSASMEDRKAIYAQLLALGTQRIDEPNTTPPTAAHASGSATGRASRQPRTPRH